jgi:hydroxymethylpyrimidine/phosphomethylpyrimidine kinase
MSRPPRLLTIAGSDSGGGAGIQADLKTFVAHGAYGMSALTAVTAQNTVEVRRVEVLAPELVAAQIEAVFDDIGVDAVKVGMLGNAEVVRAVARCLGERPGPAVVVDPVMIAKSGDALLADDAVEALMEDLLPLATLVTPNLPEAERLTGIPASGEAGREAAARAFGGRPVLIKGGHGEGDTVVDLLYDGEGFHRYSQRRIQTLSTHGTGCTLSASIAARLGRGELLAQAVKGAIEYLSGALAAAYPLGRGHGPVNHLYRLRGWT